MKEFEMHHHAKNMNNNRTSSWSAHAQAN